MLDSTFLAELIVELVFCFKISALEELRTGGVEFLTVLYKIYILLVFNGWLK
jgi:hypothetical protein